METTIDTKALEATIAAKRAEVRAKGVEAAKATMATRRAQAPQFAHVLTLLTIPAMPTNATKALRDSMWANATIARNEARTAALLEEAKRLGVTV